jgi:Glucokinase
VTTADGKTRAFWERNPALHDRYQPGWAAGGILLRFKEAFASSPFRERFERKGRFGDMLAKIPTCLILEESPALLGLAHLPLTG